MYYDFRFSRRPLRRPRAVRMAQWSVRAQVAPSPAATPFAGCAAGSIAEVPAFGSNPDRLRPLPPVQAAPPCPATSRRRGGGAVEQGIPAGFVRGVASAALARVWGHGAR
jgi:hypothetical protein